MLDNLIPQIEEVQAQGGTVVLKWDGERSENRYTVVIVRHDIDFVRREDCDDITATLTEGIAAFRALHAH